MAASVPTVDAVMLKSFGRPKIMEALELFGVRANARTGAKALKEQLLQLIQDQTPCRMVGDGMVMMMIQRCASARSCSSGRHRARCQAQHGF